MSQEEVIRILEKVKKPLSRTEIAKILNKDLINISHSIARLIKGHQIKIIEIDREQAMIEFHCKRRMRLYYI